MGLQNGSFDELLEKHVGEFKAGQIRIAATVSLFWITNALAFLSWVFTARDPMSASPRAWACTSPGDAACAAVWASDDPAKAFCSLAPEHWAWTNTDSLVSRFNLVCGDAWKVQVTNSIMFAGCFVGSGLFGALCDVKGRKRPLFISTAIIATATLLSLAAPSYPVMALARAVTGFGAAGQSSAIFLLSTEPVGPSYRGLASISSLIVFTLGEFVLVGLAAALPNWRHLTLAAGLANAAALCLWPCVPESARWLLSKGRAEEARALLRRICAANGSRLPEEEQLVVVCSTSGPPSSASSEAGGWSSEGEGCSPDLQVLPPPCCATREPGRNGGRAAAAGEGRAPQLGACALLCQPALLFRCLVLMLTFFSLNATYYGIAMSSGALPGSLYVTFTLGTAAELAAVFLALLLVDRAGRHILLSLGLLLGGGACVGCAFVGGAAAQAVLSAAGKFGVSVAMACASTYAAELWPTPIRATSMGLFSQASRLGSIAAPLVIMAGASAAAGGSANVLPYTSMGCVCLLSGLLMLLMPETLGAAMPESMQDLAALQSVFTAKPWRQGCMPTLAFLFRTRAASLPAACAAKPIAAARLADAGKDCLAACESGLANSPCLHDTLAAPFEPQAVPPAKAAVVARASSGDSGPAPEQ